MGCYLGCIAAVLTIVALAMYLIFFRNVYQMNYLIILSAVIVVIAQIAVMILQNSYIPLVCSVFSTIGFAAFAIDSVPSFTDYINKIAMFGHAEMIGIIIPVCILMLLSCLMFIISSFMKTAKTVS